MQTVSRLAEAGLRVWEIEGTEWKLATRNNQKGEKRVLQCELIFSWFLFILQIRRPNRAYLILDSAGPSHFAK
jgi:hypothetical protein